MKKWIVGVVAALAAGVAWAEVVVTAEHESGLMGGYYSLSIDNASDSTIAAVRVELEYVTPGRSVPWAVQPQRISVPGGIEPGEVRVLSDYAAPTELAQAREYEVVVNVLDVQIFDPDGSPIE